MIYSFITRVATCADPESFVKGGPTLTTFIRGDRIQTNTTKSGTSSARQQNAIKMTPSKWRFTGVPMMAQH